MNAQLAHIADMLKKPPVDGYVAERHGLQPQFIIVWAPCGCYWIGNEITNFVTCCQMECCNFSNLEAERAIRALKAAEEAILQAEEPGGVRPILVGEGQNAPEAPVGDSLAEDNMISEGSPVASAATEPEGTKPLTETLLDT